MSNEFKRVVIVGRTTDPRVSEPMAQLRPFLEEQKVTVLDQDRVSEADLIIAIGGDGTMLYASAMAREFKTPILGVNRGRLGFLADVKPEDMLDSVGQVLNGNYSTDSRLILKATLYRQGKVIKTAYALNDVVLQRKETGRMVDFETRVDGRYVNTHSGDGLIVATPTGSTAYALSCGGPIIEPQLDALVVVPVCPHTLTDRPIVMSAHQPIEARLLERDDTKAEITVDGFSMGGIHPTDKLEIKAANSRVTLVHPPGYDFYGILRSKLYWGRDSRIRD